MKAATAVLFASMLAANTSDVQVPGNPACVQDFPTAVAADPNATVVMCGLDNPRGHPCYGSPDFTSGRIVI